MNARNLLVLFSLAGKTTMNPFSYIPVLLGVFIFAVPPAFADAESPPLYLHFLSPAYHQNPDHHSYSPGRILSTRVYPGQDFDIAVGTDEQTLTGRIELRGGKYSAHLQGHFGTSTGFFEGGIELEKPFAPQGYGGSGGFVIVCFVLSTNAGYKTFIAAETASEKEGGNGLTWWGIPIAKGPEYSVADQVYARLLPLFRKCYSDIASTNYHADGLHFEYKVTTFDFPYTGPANAMHEATRQPGPNPGGILCDVRLGKGRYTGQSVPGLRDRGKYQQLLLTPYSSKSDIHLVIDLRYPEGTSKEFLKEFNQFVTELENEVH